MDILLSLTLPHINFKKSLIKSLRKLDTNFTVQSVKGCQTQLQRWCITWHTRSKFTCLVRRATVAFPRPEAPPVTKATILEIVLISEDAI